MRLIINIIPRFRILFQLILVFFLVEMPFQRILSFGGNGPFQHSTITAEAIKRIDRKSNFSLSMNCYLKILQMSMQSDDFDEYKKNPTYHCDNNDLPGCSFRLNEFLSKAYTSTNHIQAIFYTGLALHLVQDFYSHSNWVEIHNFSFVLADIESFKKIPPPSYIQTGYYPDLFLENPNAQLDCYFKDKNAMKSFIFGATHDCLNKDSNFSKRGFLFAENSSLTLHELSAEYAIRHSEKIIESIFKANPFLKICMVSDGSLIGCNIPSNIYKKVSNN